MYHLTINCPISLLKEVIIVNRQRIRRECLIGYIKKPGMYQETPVNHCKEGISSYKILLKISNELQIRGALPLNLPVIMEGMVEIST